MIVSPSLEVAVIQCRACRDVIALERCTLEQQAMIARFNNGQAQTVH